MLEAGSGAGAALLCLAARVAGISGVGVERDPALVAVAARNAAANGWAGAGVSWRLTSPGWRISVVSTMPSPIRRIMRRAAPPRPMPSRDAARRAAPELFGAWAAAMGRRLRPRGTLTWIVAAAVLPALALAVQNRAKQIPETDIAISEIDVASCRRVTLKDPSCAAGKLGRPTRTQHFPG